MFDSGVMTGLLFAMVGMVYEKSHSREIFKMSGFGRMMPGTPPPHHRRPVIAGMPTAGRGRDAHGLVFFFLCVLFCFLLGDWQSLVPLVGLFGRAGRPILT